MADSTSDTITLAALQTLLQKRIDVLDTEQKVNATITSPETDRDALRYHCAMAGAIHEVLQLAWHLGLSVQYRVPRPVDAEEDDLYPSSVIYETARARIAKATT